MNLRSLIIIAGPTATGKSDLAIRLAKEIGGVIINADSRQIYKEIKIGTARPSDAQMDEVKHFLYGTVSVKDNYNIYRYQQDVFELLKTIPKEQTPILVGGTGLYIDSVVYNYKLNPQSKNIITPRGDLSNLTTEELQQQIPKDILEKLNNSDRNNPRRLQRIIEKGNVLIEKGESFPNRYFVIDLPKDLLKTRIAQRIEQMFENGLIEENKVIYEAGLNKYPALNTIGYKEFNGYFENEKTIGEVKSEMLKNTIKYVKRQRTWFKRNTDAIWTTDFGLIQKESQNLLRSASSI